MIAFVLDFFDRRPNLIGYAVGIAVLALWVVSGGFDVAP